jgi:hypothetical protein
MSDTLRAAHRGRRHFTPLVWAASVVSAAVLVLGVNGTLSSWTQAIITNDTNTVATANGVVLKEVGPDGTAAHTAQTCVSSQGTGATNTYTCSTINKYGGTTSPLQPGGSQTTDVTFTNTGAGNGTSFTLKAGACTQTPAASTAVTPNIPNLCTAGTGEIGVSVSCVVGTTYTGTPWTDLVYPAGTFNGLTTTLTHGAAGLTAGSSWTCRFVVTLNTNANPADQGIQISQPLTWTLNG